MVLSAIPFLTVITLVTNRFTAIVAAFFLGLTGQAIKVTADALVQSKIEDEYRGRTFAFYDVAVNGAIVLGALFAALVLPQSGLSRTLPVVIIVVLAGTALGLLNSTSFSADSAPTK